MEAKDKPTIVVTGAGGFVGGHLCTQLAAAGYRVRGITTGNIAARGSQDDVSYHRVSRPYPTEGWTQLLSGAQGVVHLAALVHQMHGNTTADEYDAVNHQGTRLVAEQAAKAGVRSFVFVSTVKVNGDVSPPGGFSAADRPQPSDGYGQSKWRAEQALQQLGEATGMCADVIRPPLVYGPGVGANFLRMLRWIDKGYPLPLGAIDNRRSLVSVWNLCDLVRRLLATPRTRGATWMVCDGEDVSTPALIRKIAAAMSRPARLFPVPASLLLAAGRLAGAGDSVARLCESLTVDISQTRSELGWKPPLDVDAGLLRTAAWYREEALRHVG